MKNKNYLLDVLIFITFIMHNERRINLFKEYSILHHINTAKRAIPTQFFLDLTQVVTIPIKYPEKDYSSSKKTQHRLAATKIAELKQQSAGNVNEDMKIGE